jgi:hypothetical protein
LYATGSPKCIFNRKKDLLLAPQLMVKQLSMAIWIKLYSATQKCMTTFNVHVPVWNWLLCAIFRQRPTVPEVRCWNVAAKSCAKGIKYTKRDYTFGCCKSVSLFCSIQLSVSLSDPFFKISMWLLIHYLKALPFLLKELIHCKIPNQLMDVLIFWPLYRVCPLANLYNHYLEITFI